MKNREISKIQKFQKFGGFNSTSHPSGNLVDGLPLVVHNKFSFVRIYILISIEFAIKKSINSTKIKIQKYIKNETAMRILRKSATPNLKYYYLARILLFEWNKFQGYGSCTTTTTLHGCCCLTATKLQLYDVQRAVNRQPGYRSGDS